MSNSPTPRKKPVKQSAPVAIPMPSLDLSDVEEAGVGETELSKDSVFLVEAAAINESVEMEITTSVVPSPARVIRHMEFPSVQSGASDKSVVDNNDEGSNTASKNARFFFPDSIKADKNTLGMPYIHSAKRLDFGSSNPSSSKITKDTKTKPTLEQVKKTGRIVPSKYMQPRTVTGGKANRDAEISVKRNPADTSSIIEKTSTQPSQLRSKFVPLITLETSNRSQVQSLQQNKLEESTRLEKRGPKGSTPVGKNQAIRQSGNLDQEDWDFSIDLSSIASHDSKLTNSSHEFLQHPVDVSMTNGGSYEQASLKTKRQHNVTMTDLVTGRCGKRLSRATSLHQPPASASKYNRIDTEKKMKAPDRLEELSNDLLYGRYLQWVYLDAMAEKAFKEQEQQAMVQLMAIREMVIRSREEEERLKKVVQQKEERKRLFETLQVMEETLPSILSFSSEVLDVHDSMSERLDAVRSVMPCTEIYVPGGDEDRRAYEGEIRQALAESASLLTDILGSTEEGQQVAVDAKEGASLMTDLLSVVDSNMKAREECGNQIKEIAKLSLDETSLNIQLNLKNQQEDSTMEISQHSQSL